MIFAVKRRGKTFEVFVDDKDWDIVKDYRWYAQWSKSIKTYYIRGYKKGDKNFKQVLIHRLIMGVKSGEYIDHRNGDPLDNRRSNLRICTKSQNSMNRKPYKMFTSRYKGVCFHRDTGKWQATIKVRGEQIYLGIFVSEKDAAFEYDKKARELFKEFAKLNFEEG